jgi:hypothetical protein
MEEAKAAKINDPEAEAAESARNGLGITPAVADAPPPVMAKSGKPARAK